MLREVGKKGKKGKKAPEVKNSYFFLKMTIFSLVIKKSISQKIQKLQVQNFMIVYHLDFICNKIYVLNLIRLVNQLQTNTTQGPQMKPKRDIHK